MENPADGCRQHVPVSHTSSFPRSSRVNKKRRLAPSRSARSRVKSDGDLKQDQGNTGAEDHEGASTAGEWGGAPQAWMPTTLFLGFSMNLTIVQGARTPD